MIFMKKAHIFVEKSDLECHFRDVGCEGSVPSTGTGKNICVICLQHSVSRASEALKIIVEYISWWSVNYNLKHTV